MHELKFHHVQPPLKLKMTKYILQSSIFGPEKNVKNIDSITWTSKVFDDLLSSSNGSFMAVAEHSKHLLQTLDRLARRMKEMKDVPLKVYNVQPISAAFRGCDPFPPKQHPLMFGIGASLGRDDEVISACPRTLNVLVQLEGSGRWPEEKEELSLIHICRCRRSTL